MRKWPLARREGVLRREPEQLGDPVGYFAFFADPDGNTTELSWGRRVGLEVIGGKTRRIIFHRLAGEDYTSKGYLGNTEHGDGQQEKR